MATILFLTAATLGTSSAQRVTYSAPLGDNIRTTTFDILGFCGGNLLIYKNAYSDYRISVYDSRLKILDEAALKFLPADVSQADFVNLGDRVVMCYQYTRRRDLYCDYAVLGPRGELLEKPRTIDRTLHPDRVVGQIPYHVLYSGDRSRIMILEVVRVEDSLAYRIRTFLYDDSMRLTAAGSLSVPYLDETDTPRNFCLSDQGGLYFTMGHPREPGGDYYGSLTVMYKPPRANEIREATVSAGDAPVKTGVVLRPSDRSGSLWLAAMVGDERGRDVGAIALNRYTLEGLRPLEARVIPLTDSLKEAMRSGAGAPRQTFDDYRLTDLVTDEKGHAVLVGEQRYLDADDARHYDHIAVFEISPEYRLAGAWQVSKQQGPEMEPPYVSFLMVNTGQALHFLINKYHRIFRFLNNFRYILTDYRYGPDHTLKEMPLFRGLDNKIRWAPRYGRQVSREKVVIPCVSGQGLVFAMIDYGAPAERGGD